MIIKDAVSDVLNQFKPKASIYFELLRNGELFCGLTTFYRYANLFIDKLVDHKFIKEKDPLIATRPFEYLHIDTTFIRTRNGLRRAAFVKDNFSKFTFGFALLPNGKSEFIRNLLEQVFEKYNLYSQTDPICIISDGGSENKGAVIEWINSLTNINVKKLIANVDFPSTNAMSESVHHLFKTYFAPAKIFADDLELQNELEAFLHFSNHNWFPIDFFGSSPVEVLANGFIDKNQFSEKIKMAQKQRVIENRDFSLCCKFN